MNHTFTEDHCDACGEPCAHRDTNAPRRRGRRPKPHAAREKLTIYISKSLQLAILSRYKTENVSQAVRQILEDLFPNNRAEAEGMIHRKGESE